MIAYNSNEDSPHADVAWVLWYAADVAHALGQLVAIDYSDSTPDVAFTYDRLGRQLTVTDILGTRTNVYDALNLLEERHPDGTALVRAYDPFGRPVGISFGSDYAVSYGYDSSGRFSTVAVSNGATFTYSYVPNSSLLSGYTNDLGLAVAYEYEPLRDVKTLVSNAWGTNVVSTFAYTYDEVGRRTQRVDSSLTTNVFGYNPRSELISAEMGTNTYAYAYDPIGNRTSTSENGVTNVYASNELNQYTSLNSDATNSTAFAYDADGNMSSDGTWFYAWDAENRLIEVQPLVTNIDSTLVQYMYDAQSRRIARREFTWNVFSGVTNWYYVQGRAYCYDGWNLLHELKPHGLPRTMVPYIPQTNLYLTGVNGLVAAKYVWGLDLSGTLQGAGGIGGLLMQHHSDYTLPWFSFCDANGNVVGVTSSNQSSHATHTYTPFGTLLVCAVPFIPSYQFSTKEHDRRTGLIYYGFRYYSPNIGRWMSRDPIADNAFRTHSPDSKKVSYAEEFLTYMFAVNSPINKGDYLGLMAKAPHPGTQNQDICNCPYRKLTCAQIIQCEEKNLDWLNSLPPCPCLLQDVPATWSTDPKWVLNTYHPGSTTCRRVSGPNDTRQQCCYDANGNLITGGAAAGTPDRDDSIKGHRNLDIIPFKKCGWQEYHKIRPPNNGNKCRENVL